MLTEHLFDCKYLFCTSALDVGFSINDERVKHIICMLSDWNSVIQAIGRKRMKNDNDSVTLYLADYSNQRIGLELDNIRKYFEHFYYLKKNGAIKYCHEYEKRPDKKKIVYYKDLKNGTCEPCVDMNVYYYYAWLRFQYDTIKKIDSQHKYQDWVLEQFGFPSSHERAISHANDILSQFAEQGRIFTKDDKDEIAMAINYKKMGS
jgi:hypothetical protein